MEFITIEVESSSVNVRRAFKGKSADSRSRTYLTRLNKILKMNPKDKAKIQIKHWTA